MAKPIIKRFSNGVKVTFECDDAQKRDAFVKDVKKALKRSGCSDEPIVTTFDDPVPSCGPDEKNC